MDEDRNVGAQVAGAIAGFVFGSAANTLVRAMLKEHVPEIGGRFGSITTTIGCIGIAAAVSSAVHNAIDREVTDGVDILVSGAKAIKEMKADHDEAKEVEDGGNGDA